MKDKCIKELQKLTGKKNIIFTERGNRSIKLSLKIAKEIGRTICLVQDQGGWLKYIDYPKRMKIELIRIKTHFGLLDERRLSEYGPESILLINSMPGYFAEEKMDRVARKCNQNNIFLINDITASIGTDIAKFGDIVFASFGQWKPLSIGGGSFIAFDDDYAVENEEPKIDYSKLYERLTSFQPKVEFIKKLAAKVKDDLKEYKVLYPHENGLNVVVLFSTDKEKEEIIEYCDKNKYEYTLCPRYIRVESNAVSIELKRFLQ